MVVRALPVNTMSGVPPDQTILKLSEKLLYTVKTESATDSLEKELVSLKVENLITGLSNCSKKDFLDKHIQFILPDSCHPGKENQPRDL